MAKTASLNVRETSKNNMVLHISTLKLYKNAKGSRQNSSFLRLVKTGSRDCEHFFIQKELFIEIMIQKKSGKSNLEGYKDLHKGGNFCPFTYELVNSNQVSNGSKVTHCVFLVHINLFIIYSKFRLLLKKYKCTNHI